MGSRKKQSTARAAIPLRMKYESLSTRHRFVSGIAENLRVRCGVAAQDALVVGVSGGPDSMSLLAALAAIARRKVWELKLTAAYVHHHLRDREAEAEAAMVEAVAHELGVGFARRDIDPGRRAGNTYANAREDRYRALGDIARKAGAAWVVTAHHGTDQLESVLMALMRGAGPAGLGAMSWVRGCEDKPGGTEGPGVQVIRPMLDVGKSRCRKFCEEFGIPFVQDASNSNVEKVRARLRLRVVPELLAMSPGLDERIWRMTEVFAGLERMVTEEAQNLISTGIRREHPDGSIEYDRRQLRGHCAVVLGAIIRLAAADEGAGMDEVGFERVDAIVRAINDDLRQPRRFELAGRVVIEIHNDRVWVRDGCRQTRDR